MRRGKACLEGDFEEDRSMIRSVDANGSAKQLWVREAIQTYGMEVHKVFCAENRFVHHGSRGVPPIIERASSGWGTTLVRNSWRIRDPEAIRWKPARV